MKLSDYDLRQLDEEVINSLSLNAVKNLTPFISQWTVLIKKLLQMSTILAKITLI